MNRNLLERWIGTLHTNSHHFRSALLIALLIPCFLSCSLFEKNKLQSIIAAGELVVLTRASPTTYFETPEGPAGFEHDLVKSFAESLGVNPRFIVAEKFSDIIPRFINGEANMAAAGITVTESRAKLVQFGPLYQEIRQQVIYRLGTTRPTNVQELIGRQIEVQSGTSYAERLTHLQQEYPELKWAEVDKETEELLLTVWQGLLEITIADSNIVAVNRQYFPDLQIAFSFSNPESLAWAFPQGPDQSLHDAAMKFLAKSRASGELAQLVDRYYGPASRSNFINLSVYKVRLRSILPRYQLFFEKAGKQYGLDWRLLAAIGYQESFWDPEATSPTGVRGIMMLTEETASHLGIKDRLDAAESIGGGARYIKNLIERMPPGVTEPDRLWMALASYNIGINHLEDARILTQKQGRDPNKWNDVKNYLPWLADEAWHIKTKFGYARGMEPVLFVNRVRTYYDVLVKIDEEEKVKKKPKAFDLKAPAI
ncbi:MAG: membrane-bound lytic murein transglycosylase MltF [Sulfuricaulis sp.]|uniref:membrane-bound lytic murein transglycosylase MltF n=1 Tax=Sulfuricaulis sp. TaxID=2003553 RepID=UPI0025D29CDC|nr:membrane-bound lytic murein transglycosylase MltF [Sulfuricaulis sp.]MCR4346584.1 membrane-bound lytic murein transglycosylase MltF [Sulfuricaulis sp.]